MTTTDITRGLTLIIPEKDAQTYREWAECAAFRIVDLGDGTGRLELTNDLELITRPGAE